MLYFTQSCTKIYVDGRITYVEIRLKRDGGSRCSTSVLAFMCSWNNFGRITYVEIRLKKNNSLMVLNCRTNPCRAIVYWEKPASTGYQTHIIGGA